MKSTTSNITVNKGTLTFLKARPFSMFAILMTVTVLCSIMFALMMMTALPSSAESEEGEMSEVKEDPIIAEVYEPTTGLVLSPTSIKAINTLEDINTLRPKATVACAIFRIDENMNILDDSGNVLCPLIDSLDKFKGRVIPIFEIENEAESKAVLEFATDQNMVDMYVMSDDVALLTSARKQNGAIGAIYNAAPEGSGALDESVLLDIRAKANTARARAVLLDAKFAVRSNVDYLQALGLYVWFATDKEDDTEIYQIITSGANGIECTDTGKLFGIYREFLDTTLTRKSILIGHRGVPPLAPENSIEGALLAASIGASHIECDIYITTDGSVVISHDGSTERTGDKTVVLEESTLEEVKTVTLTAVDEYEGLHVPEFREYMTALKGVGAAVVIEIKSGKTSCIDTAMEIIRDLNMEKEVCFISFDVPQLAYLVENYPDMSSGLLCSEANERLVPQTVLTLINLLRPINATHNTNFNGLGIKLLSALRHRSIATWTWTLDNYEELFGNIMNGVASITTNKSFYMTNVVNDLSAQSEYELKVGESFTVMAKETTYGGSTKDTLAESLIISDGGTGITVNDADGTVTATKAGTATFLLKKTYKMPSSDEYTILTQPITVKVTDDSATTEADTQSTETTNASGANDTKGGDNTALLIGAIVGAAAIAVAGAVIAIIAKKKKS